MLSLPLPILLSQIFDYLIPFFRRLLMGMFQSQALSRDFVVDFNGPVFPSGILPIPFELAF